MSLFEQSLINNYVFSENLENQVSGGAPITELLDAQSSPVIQGLGIGSPRYGGSGNRGKNILSSKKHFSVPIGLVMTAHTEYIYPNQRFHNSQIQDNLFDNLINLVKEESPILKNTKAKAKSKSLKRNIIKQKQTKKKEKPRESK